MLFVPVIAILVLVLRIWSRYFILWNLLTLKSLIEFGNLLRNNKKEAQSETSLLGNNKQRHKVKLHIYLVVLVIWNGGEFRTLMWNTAEIYGVDTVRMNRHKLEKTRPNTVHP
jgi:hypothetical protein